MKRLPLGCGAKEEDMDITELEEGEAFSSHENNDMSMDLDSLSYIEAKLEHLLGHFRKDFEGGVVSAENLGAKFGGYGTFLPTDQHSPVWSHSTSSPRDQNCGSHEPVNINHIKNTSESNLVMEDLGMQFPNRIKESAPRLWLANQSTQSSDQKPLRVRIKVGSDTVPPKKNTELYSGLGLDVSPASSLNASPTDSEGLSHQPKDGPDVSPSSILKMMTSFPLRDGLVLSPLPDHLICLTQKEKFQTEKSTHRFVQRGVKVNSKGHSILGDDNGLRDFKVKSSSSDTFSEESKHHQGKDAENCIQGEEIVRNKLKLPHLSRSVEYGKSTAKLDDISRIGNDLKEECLLSDPVKEETDAYGTALIKPRKGRNIKEEKLVISTKSSIHVQTGRKLQTEEVMGGQEVLSHEEYDTEVTTAKQTTSVGNKKPKDKHVMQGAIVPKDNSNANGNFTKTKIGKSRLLDQQKGMNKCTKFSGDRELGHGYNDVESVGTLSPLMPMNNELSGKNTLKDCTSKGRMMMSVKKKEKAPRFNAPSEGVSDLPPSSGNGFGGDADDWVACDKCETWRLLPPGRNPNSFPDTWVCSMLDWLPGLNRCSVSEEESTNALIARYQPSASNGQTIQAGQSTAAMSGPYLSGAGWADQSHENQELPSVPCVGKMRPAVKEISNSINISNSEQLVNSSKKNIQASTQSRSLNEVVQILPAADDLLHSTKHDTEKRKYKHNEKNKQIVYCSEGGDMKSSKTKNKGGPDRSDQYEDFSRGAKRTRRETEHHMDESRLHDYGGPFETVRPCTSSGLSADASWKEEHRSKERLKVNKNDGNGDAHIISYESGELDMQKYDAKDVRKRQHKQVYPDSFVNGHLPHDIMDIIEETNENNHKTGKGAKVSKSEGKEGSTSKSSGKTAKKGKNIEYQLLGTDPESAVSRQRVDATKPLVKELGSLQPSLAAASSSSKVSGSIKNKDILQEMRGSPVESVSSSPLRISNHDKAKFTRRSLDRQDKGRRERLLDTPSKDMEYSGVSKARVYVTPSQLENCHNADGCNGNVRLSTQYPTKLQTDQWHDEGKRNDCDGLRDASHGNKFRKGSLSGPKEKGGDLKPEPDKDKLSDYSKESSLNAFPEDNIGWSGKCRILEKSRINSDKICAKDPEDQVTIEKAKTEPQLKLNVKAHNISRQDQNQNQQLDDDGEKSSKKSISTKTDQIESSRKEKPKSLPPSGRSQNQAWKLANGSLIGASEGGSAAVKRAKYVKGLENQNADQPTKSRNPASNGNRIQDVDALSPLKKDQSSQAANSAIKEATNLKHMADRVKNSGESGESTSLYFQAALKFLHGASLLEVSSSETFKQNEMIQSTQTYSGTAKLCEFCAHEYEKSKDMAAAALAYKCMEVAYMRVVYMSHSNVSRARQELQTTLQIVPGESPSSSASDIDNLNNPASLDKVPLTKGVTSPQVVGHHVITASNRPSFQRLLNFAQEVNYSMEASRKSRAAFTAAKPRNKEVHQKESLSSVKRALDYSFYDVEGLLRLVRLAMDAMSC